VNLEGRTPRLYVLLGNPVHHSLSPTLQNAAMRAVGIDAVYIGLRAWRELVGPLMRAVALGGGGGNVTVPHKRVAALALDHATDAAHATGACNVFWWDGERGLVGDNTDVDGFRFAAETLMGSRLAGSRLLLLGAGGAARAVAYACLKDEVERVDILNRTRAKAVSLVSDLGGGDVLRILDGGQPPDSERYDLIVNATSLGLADTDPLPLPLHDVKGGAVLDLVYGRQSTAWVRAARQAGLPAQDGRFMLVEQAASSFQRWFQIEPPRETMLRAVGLGG
jgi:shikimate dehydrogenase